MKIKSKLILAATSLLVLSGVAAGTSTYAWYTANRQVELAVTNISATTQLTTLGMKYEYTQNARNGLDAAGTDGTDPFITTDESAASSAIAGTFSKKLTDVSSMGDGEFVKPIFGADQDLAGHWLNEDAYIAAPTNYDGDVYHHKLVFTFTLTGVQPVALYLSPLSTVTDAADATTGLSVENAVRFSVSTIDESDVTTEVLYANPNGTGESTYLANADDVVADTVSGSFGILEKNASNGFFDKVSNYTEAEMYTGTGTPQGATTKYSNPAAGYITESVGPFDGISTVTEIYHVAVDTWIEGTDPQCVDDLTDSDYFGLFDLHLAFYTLEISSMEPTE